MGNDGDGSFDTSVEKFFSPKLRVHDQVVPLLREVFECTSPAVAAKNAVAAPRTVVTIRAIGAYSNNGEQRATRNTPAVTIVAECSKELTGVGPSMASGSQQ